MTDAPQILNVQRTDESAPLISENTTSPLRPPPFIKDLSREDMGSSSRIGLLRRDTYEERSSNSRRSSVDTLKSVSKKRMSLNVSSASPTIHSRRLSRFKEASELSGKSPIPLKRKSTNKPGSLLRASPTLGKRKGEGSRHALKARSTKEFGEQSVGDSRSFSELEDLQNLYHKHLKKSPSATPASMMLNDLSPNANVEAEPKKVSMRSRVAQMYYQMLRKKFTRNMTQVAKDTGEFFEQVQLIKDNVTTPNDERIRDLVLVEKDPLEKLNTYHDRFPLLGLRKGIMRVLKTISLVCAKIISNPLFEYFILCVIIVNSVLLAMDDPTTSGIGSAEADTTLLVIYTVECILKIIGMGFVFNKNAYLHDFWNVMDFVIVVTGYIPIVLASDGLNLQAFRSLRVLRPLRTISNIKALKMLINTLMNAMKPLLETLFILFFVFLIFAIAGLQLFSGLLKKRCFSVENGTPLYDEDQEDDNFEKFCNNDDDCPNSDTSAYVCGKMIKNPNFDITNFDTIQNSFLMVFQIVTLEGWSDIMFYLQRTFTPIAAIYFVILIIICSFFLLNLTLAVLKTKFDETNQGDEKAVNRNQRYWLHGEGYFNSLEKHKRDILKLVRKRKEEEIKFNKYEIHKESLKAITKGKVGVSKRRVKNNTASRFAWLRETLIYNTITKSPGKKFLAALTASVKRIAVARANSSQETNRSGLTKADTIKMDEKSTATQNTPQILITSKTKSLNIKKVATELMQLHHQTQAASPTENIVTEKPEFGNSAIKPLLANSPLSASLQKDFSSPIRQIDSARLLATPTKENKSPEKTEQAEANKLPSLVIIPSVVEPADTSQHSINAMTSKNFLTVKRNNFMSSNLKPSSPIRPHLSEKIRVQTVENDEKKEGGVSFINIAGIRNKTVEKPKLLAKNTFLMDATPVPDSKEISFNGNDEHSVFDLLEAKSPAEKQVKPRESFSKTVLLKQINQVKKPKNAENLKKSGLSQPRLSQALTSLFELDNEQHDKPMDGIAPTGILDDSDFFDEKQRQELIRKKRHFERNGTKKLSGARSPAKRRAHGMLTSFGALPESRALLKGESHTHIGGHRHVRGSVETEKVASNLRMADDEPDETHIIDVRYLKPVPAFERDYDTDCIDDVLPLKKEKEKQLRDEREQKMLKETRLRLEYKVTGLDEKRARDRLDSYYSKSASHASILGTHKSRRLREDESMMDPQLSRSVVERDIETNNSKQTLNRNATKSFSKRKTLNPNRETHHATNRTANSGPSDNKANDEDYFPQDKINDYIEVYRWMERPLPHELEMENADAQIEKLTKDFPLEEDYKGIRRKDLEKEVIAENNWSGDNVLAHTTANFAVDKVKKALNKQDYDIWRTGYWGVFHGFRRTCKKFIESSFFNAVIMLSVFFNTIILATEGLINDQSTQDLLSAFNLLFTVIFTIEMGLKLLALNITGYVQDKMNIFDAAIVIISLVEAIFLSGSGNKALSAFRTIRLFRTFRVLRVTKLLRSLKYMQVIIVVIGRSMNKFIYILILLFLFVFIYTLLGMQLFGGGLNLDDNTGQDRTRQNFDSFWNAFMTSFQIMSIENWQQILFLAIRSTTVNTMISILYLVSWIWIGNYIFLNLFLAILLDEFTVEDVQEEFDELKEDDGGTVYSSTSRSQTLDRSEKMGTQKTLSKDSSYPKATSASRVAAPIDDYDDEDESRQVKNDKTAIRICEKSLYFLSKQNLLRRACLKIIQHPWFERVILGMIVMSSIKLAFDTYFDDDENTIIDISNQIDDGLNVFFAIEALMKIISLGLVVDKGCYLRDTWNQLDFIIVIAAILDMSFENINLSFIRILRLLRTLRPLRFITHNKSMKLIVTALIESVGAILNVIIVVILIWLMFAILAINIVGSKLGYCQFKDHRLNYGISNTACPAAGGVWTNPNVNFDNVFQGMISLFILSTQEGWPDIMYSVVDANDASEGPIENNQIVFAYIYFVVFIFVGSYFLVNLFIGVIFLEFAKAEKRENHLKKFLTPQQQNWVIMQRLIVAIKPDTTGVEPKNKFMRKIFRITNHTKFEVFIMCVIVLNVLLMAVTYEGSSDGYNEVLKYINWCFSGIFAVELVLKHIGLGFKRFWSNGWNRFDAFVVAASALDILMDIMQQSFFSFIRIGPQLARVFRVLRVSRLLKLVKQFEGLQKMLNTLVFTLPSLLNVGALLFLVYFIYSILATFIFNSIKLGDRIDDTRYRHFQNFGSAIITLFRCSTGEDWWIFMFDTIYPQLCTDGTNTCGTWAAYPFWLSFIVVCQFIFLNLFILVILQQFEEYHLNDDNPVNAFAEMMDKHITPAWEELAKRHGGTHIHESQLVDFFCRFGYPYGFKNSHQTKAAITREIMHMSIPEDDRNMIYYNDLIFILIKNGFYNVQRDLINEGKLELTPDQKSHILLQEDKTQGKLERLKKTLRIPSLRRKSTIKDLTKSKIIPTANPIPRILFMGMTMRAWLTYAHRITEKKKAAEENGYAYASSESDQDDYTFNSEKSDSDSESEDSRKKVSGYIKEEAEVDSSDDMEKERINTEQQSLIDIDHTDRKHKLEEERDYIFNGDMSPPARDEEAGPSYNVANLNLMQKTRNQRNQGGTKITITSHSSIKGASHLELERNKSASRLTPQKLIKFVEGSDFAELPAKASFSFLDPEMSPKKLDSKKNSKSNLEENEKPSIINFNINNNVVINNNYYIHPNAPIENGEPAALSPISRETSITIERNISVNRAPARRADHLNPRLAENPRDIEEGALAIRDSKDTPSSKRSNLSK